MMKKFLTATVFIVTLLGCHAGFALDLTRAVELYKNSIADVGFELKYDEKGEVPSAIGVYCGTCSVFHDNDLGSLLANHQDLLVSGFIVSKDELFIPAMLIESVGIKDIYVNFNGRKIPAEIIAGCPDQGALKLKTKTPLPGAVPLEFVPCKKDEKLYSYSRIREGGQWVYRCSQFSPQLFTMLGNGRLSMNMPGNSLILNSEGKTVAMSLNNNESFENISWKLNYTQWNTIPVEKFYAVKQKLEKHLQKSLLPVSIYMKEWKLSRREKIMNIVPEREISSYAFMLPEKLLFMPLLSSPQQHALIEKIIVHTPAGNVECRIAGVMKKFGGVLLLPVKQIKLDVPVIAPHISTLLGDLGEIVWCADVGVYPGRLKVTVNSDILISVVRTYHNTLSGSGLKKGVPDLLFNLKGDLLGVNLSVRSFNYKRVAPFTDAAALKDMLHDPREIVPLQAMCNPPEAVGFLGVEYQTLNRELVRAVNLEHLTLGGREGLLISYVYPGSVAEKIGLKAGDILLKLIVPGGGAPIRLLGENFNHARERQFPWQNLDKIPEMYFSEIPEPWKGVKNPLTRQLANIGIGEKIGLIAVSGGKVIRKEFVIANAPAYFEIAPAFRSGALGLEVKDITFEVRRYFRMQNDTPGVIISDVSAGKAASVAGLRPFEIITAVNDQAVFNVKDFQNAIAGKSEIRLAVRRLAANRVVTVKAPIGPRM